MQSVESRAVSKVLGLAWKIFAVSCATGMLASTTFAQAGGAAPTPYATAPQPAVPPVKPFDVHMTRSFNPIAPYRSESVPEPSLSNSPRIDQLIRDGKLYLSLQDAIALALEDNLDLAIARYNLPIADTDILRTKAGGSVRGVNTGVVQTTQGGNGTGSGAGGGAGGTTGGAGGAGAGAGGIVSSTLGLGAPISSYDPEITGTVSLQHEVSPIYNLEEYGVPSLKYNTTTYDFSYLQAFATGTSLEFDFDNDRETYNSPYVALTPALSSQYLFTLKQQLLNGFGLGPNLRYLRIAKNDKKISDIAFKYQVIITVTQVEDIYWDLVNAFQDEQVKSAARDFAQKTLDDTRKQFDLKAVPAMDVMRAQVEVANRDQDLTVARTTLQLQQSLMKDALTKSLDNPVLEQMPVIPTDTVEMPDQQAFPPVEDLIDEALKNRPELYESSINLENALISRKAVRNNLLPTVTLVGQYSGTGLAGLANPNYDLGPNPVVVPTGAGGLLQNTFNNSSPDYYVGMDLEIPLRNRIHKADQFRSELEYRQNELYAQQLKKRIRIDVRNAEYALEQSVARVDAATKARDLEQKTFDITKQEQQLGAGSIYQTLTAQRDLSIAQSALVAAETAYQKAKVDLARATGTTLDQLNISIDEAKTGVVPQKSF